VVALAGCASRPTREPTVPVPSAPSLPEQPSVPPEGRAFRVVPEESLLRVLVFRGGALAKAGHNHVIASHEMSGMAWLPEDPGRASFEVRVPVQSFTIDEPELRAQEGSEFAADVPDSAREGTKRNLLSEPMLDGGRYPQIVMRAEGLEPTPEGFLARMMITVRDQTRPVSVPLRYELQGDALRVQGELSLKQTDLGLTPFSLLGGALRVEDEMRVKFSVTARAE
jgi:polyisoprenoid-binding protein YceI